MSFGDRLSEMSVANKAKTLAIRGFLTTVVAVGGLSPILSLPSYALSVYGQQVWKRHPGRIDDRARPLQGKDFVISFIPGVASVVGVYQLNRDKGFLAERERKRIDRQNNPETQTLIAR